tara:strand:+ start:700 stop:927 length:228 start_codon:yes stop_codon:yes gene_type:complete
MMRRLKFSHNGKIKTLNPIRTSSKQSLEIVDEILTPLARKMSQDHISPPKVIEESNFSKAMNKQCVSEKDYSSSN